MSFLYYSSFDASYTKNNQGIPIRPAYFIEAVQIDEAQNNTQYLSFPMSDKEGYNWRLRAGDLKYLGRNRFQCLVRLNLELMKFCDIISLSKNWLSYTVISICPSALMLQTSGCVGFQNVVRN